MRIHHKVWSVAVSVMLVAVQSLLVGPAAAAPAPPPAAWETECGSAKLGLDKVAVALAQPQKADTKDGKRVAYSPDSRGRYTPIIVIHGWTGSSTHGPDGSGSFSHRIDLTANRLGTVSATRSLIGQYQALPGAAVFTFDYHPYSARWVDDSHLGPALGKVIDCLYRASGQKVILVGHSMGGLVARYAATHPGVTGPDRGGEISTVVTFGTPNTGSVVAMLAAAGLNLGASVDTHLAVVRMILASCGGVSSNEIETGSVCDILIPPLRAFASDAGIALRAGSSELAALKPWPKSIYVDALAGETTFQVPAMSWFALPWDTRSVATGDVIVTKDSAVRGADLTKTVSCSYQLNAVRGVADTLGMTVGLVSAAQVADVPLKALMGPCFHGSLMRSIELTNEALGVVAEDIDSRQPVTVASLRSAPVPAACRHRAGTLRNGELPGIPQGEGQMGLSWVLFNRPPGKYVALGDLDGDGTGDAAASLYCNAGGVSWPELVAFYTPGPKLLGHVDLGEVGLPGSAGGQNASVNRLRYGKGAVIAEWSTQQDDDPSAVASLDYTARLSWNGRKVVASNIAATTERATVDRFLTALRKGDREAAGKLTSQVGWTVEAVTMFSIYPEALAATPTCYGLLGGLPPPAQELSESPLMDGVSRICLLPTTAGGEGARYIALGLTHLGFERWQITAVVGV